MSIEKGAAQPNLPDSFPSDIPVVGSSFIPWTAEDGGTGVQIADATDTSFDDAVAKLLEGGYTQIDGGGDRDGEVRMATFWNEAHQVSIVGATVGGQVRLSYTITSPENR